MKTKFSIKEIAENPSLLNEVLRLVRASTEGADNRFDVNLAEGILSEGKVLSLLTGKEKIEVKRDFKVSQTGNVAIEFAHTGKLTGISTTESDWYAIVLDGEEYNGEIVIFIKTERLKRIVDAAPGRIIIGVDNNKSTFKALRTDRLLLSNDLIEDYELWKQHKEKYPGKMRRRVD